MKVRKEFTEKPEDLYNTKEMKAFIEAQRKWIDDFEEQRVQNHIDDYKKTQ